MNKIVAVDVSHLFYRYIFANKNFVCENPNITAHLLLKGFIHIKEKFNLLGDDRLIAAFDCRREESWRREVYEEGILNLPEYLGRSYKGHRKLDQSIPWDRLWEIVNDIKEFLRDYTDFIVVEHDKAEADDIIYICSKFYQHDKIIIYSSDKDFRQIISERVRVFDPFKKDYLKEDDPKKYLLKHILIGDKTDNILACRKRLGPKTADTLVSDIPTLKSMLMADRDLKQRFEFNKQLIDLSKIPEDIQLEIQQQFKEPQGKFNTMKIIEFFRKYELKQLFDNVEGLHLRN